MKRPLMEILRTEYEKYHNECKKPKTFYDWANERRERAIQSLNRQLEEWTSLELKRKCVIKIYKNTN